MTVPVTVAVDCPETEGTNPAIIRVITVARLRARARIIWHFAAAPIPNWIITSKLQWFVGDGSRSPAGRGGGQASAALPLLDYVTTSPASRRLASACPALAPKCQLILARTLRRKSFATTQEFFGQMTSDK